MSGAMRDHLARQITAGLDGLRVGNATSVSRLALIARGGTPGPGVFVPGEMRENSPEKEPRSCQLGSRNDTRPRQVYRE